MEIVSEKIHRQTDRVGRYIPRLEQIPEPCQVVAERGGLTCDQATAEIVEVGMKVLTTIFPTVFAEGRQLVVKFAVNPLGHALDGRGAMFLHRHRGHHALVQRDPGFFRSHSAYSVTSSKYCSARLPFSTFNPRGMALWDSFR